MAKQTAVGWLLSELQIRLLKIKSEPDGILRETMINSFLIDAEQAEEMEKEQIEKAFSDGQETPINHPTLPHYSREEYYNDTYTQGNE